MNNKYTKEKIEEAIKVSTTWAEVCKQFGIKSCTGAQSHLKKRATYFGIKEPDHFLGRSFMRGKIWKTRKNALEYCFENSKINSHKLKQYLIQDKYKEPKCEQCNITKWQGEDVVLELDHINNIHSDNRIENLKILCPNCHALKTRKNRGLMELIDNSALEPEAQKA